MKSDAEVKRDTVRNKIYYSLLSASDSQFVQIGKLGCDMRIEELKMKLNS